MLKFALRLLSYDKKKTGKIMALVTLTLLFPCVLIFSMQNYADFQLQNAYRYGGQWDIKISGEALSEEEQKELGLQLAGRENYVSSGKVGNASEGEGTLVYVGLLQCSAPEKLLYCPLIEGRYPERENEIVVPYSCTYNGRTPADGSLSLGDCLTMEVGVRTLGNGEPIFSGRLEEGETFIPEATKEYTVVGFSVYIPLSGTQAVQAVTGLEEETPSNSFYYRSEAASCEELERLVTEISGRKAEYNFSVYRAYYENTELESVVARNHGIWLISAGAFLTCFFLSASMLLRMRRERKRQLQMLRGLGMSAGQRRVLYLLEWSGQVAGGGMGAVCGFYLYTLFLKYVLPRFLVNGLSQMEGKFHIGVFGALLALLFALGAAVLLREPSERAAFSENRRREKLRSCADLSVIFRRRSRIAKETVVIMATVSIMAISIGVPLAVGIYKQSKSLKADSVDYDAKIQYGKDYRDQIVQTLLEEEVSVAEYRYRIFGSGRILLSEETISERTWNFWKDSEYTKDLIIDGKLTLRFGVRGASKEEYEALRKQNPHLMTYAEWCDSGTLLMDDFFNFSDDWSGEAAQDNRYGDLEHALTYQTGDVISFEMQGQEGWISIEMPVGQSIHTPVLYEYPQIPALQFYVPEEWLENRGDLCVQASYQVKVRKQYEADFNERLAEWMTVYREMIGEYDYVWILEANDGIRIQFVVVFCVIFALCALCMAGMCVMLRVDLEYQTRQFSIFRGLGMSWGQAVNMRVTERMNLLLTAVMLSMVGNLALYYGLFSEYADVYGITTQEIFCFFAAASILLVCLGVADSVALTRQQYKRELIETQRQE